jgi:hypothetical protein
MSIMSTGIANKSITHVHVASRACILQSTLGAGSLPVKEEIYAYYSNTSIKE